MRPKHTKTKLAKELTKLGLSIKDFSKITGLPYRTVQGWSLGERRTSNVAFQILRIYEFLSRFTMIFCSNCEQTIIVEKDITICPYCGVKEKDCVDGFLRQPATYILFQDEPPEGF